MTQADVDRRRYELSPLSPGFRSGDQFSTSIFKSEGENPRNQISFPLTASVLLPMARYGARGETENQFKELLNLPTLDIVAHISYQRLIYALNSIEDNKFLLANKMFISKKCPVKSTYKDLMETYFFSKTQLVNFEELEEAAEIINTWVEKKTMCCIKKLFSAVDLKEETGMVLVNTIYFRGYWQDKFEVRLARNMPFYVSENRTIEVNAVVRKGIYRHGELPDMNAQFVLVPYKGRELSMLVIVPDRVDGYAEIKKKLRNVRLTSIFQRAPMDKMALFLPKIKAMRSGETKNVLQKMGLIDAFDDRANFSRISDTSLKIGKVTQVESFILNTIGTQIAVATCISGTRLLTTRVTYKRPPKYFKVDRRSYYAIYHNLNDVVLFNL